MMFKNSYRIHFYFCFRTDLHNDNHNQGWMAKLVLVLALNFSRKLWIS